MTVSPQASYQSVALRILGAERSAWTLRDSETWCMVTPVGYRPRRQGWKLHLSATVGSAHQVLRGAAGVLVAHGCAFKFAVSPRVTADLTSVRAPREHSGKFLTAYPADDDQLRTLAEELHRATLGLPGPAILSDRRYRPDSLVHYRFGCFSPPRELDDEGFYRGRLQAPDGTLTADERNAWFSPPAWARPPFDPPVRTRGRRDRGGPVLIAGRYLVREAVRHSNRGGVYRARDEHTGEDVLLKEARAHVGAQPGGTDARDWLRYEAGVLTRLAPQGIAPAPREVFEAGGHVFLAEDLIDGENLHRWSAEEASRNGGLLPVPAAWRLARELTRLVGDVHAAGFVLRDLKPTNVVMRPDGTPVLVDLECAVRTGTTVHVAGTQGFTAPEHLSGAGTGPAPGPEADCFSLGATLLHATAGINPLLAPDAPPARSAGDRLAVMVEAAAGDCPALAALAPLVLGEQLGNLHSQAWGLIGLGYLRTQLGEHTAAEKDLRRAIGLALQISDRHSRAWAGTGLGCALEGLGRFEEAEEAEPHLRRALALAEASGHHLSRTWALAGLAAGCRARGQYARSRSRYLQVLDASRRSGDPHHQAVAVQGLGDVCAGTGRHGDAEDCYRRALGTWRRIGHRAGEADTLRSLTGLLLRRHATEAARPFLDRLSELSRQEPPPVCP
ncbi:tetratricopeptide repeat protein [Streptosporangium nondiastaticum]|uniref:class III lanthionine synthetase LanKC N-terminal domain-containing protein n=1 Tax=Streptosporangium nondiastaticum TaxID=35764 RepID=UPI0011B2101E|nr:tetratricopeptide repeat protein [Streptosporangium nondiastaticum]